MSQENNTQLLARAHEASEYALGTLWEKEIYQAIQDSDLEKLESIVKNVEQMMDEREFSLKEDVY